MARIRRHGPPAERPLGRAVAAPLNGHTAIGARAKDVPNAVPEDAPVVAQPPDEGAQPGGGTADERAGVAEARLEPNAGIVRSIDIGKQTACRTDCLSWPQARQATANCVIHPSRRATKTGPAG